MFLKKLVASAFFKRDNSGKLIPTPLALILVGALIFSWYFFLEKDSANVKKAKVIRSSAEPVTKEELITVTKPEQVQLSDDFSYLNELLQEQKQAVKEPLIKAKMSRSPQYLQAPILVYDGSKDYKSSMVTPLGSMVKCILIHNIVTNNFEAPVIAQVWQDFYFRGKLLFPFGTRIFGRASAGRQRDRVVVKFHSAVFQDGRTISLKGLGLSKDGSAGLTGIIVDNSNKKVISEMAMNFLAAFTLALQDSYVSKVTGGTETSGNKRNAILQGAAGTLQKEAERIQEEIRKAEGYVIVLAGSDVVVYLEEEADVSPITR